VEAGVDDCASASRRVGLSHLCVWVDLRSPKKTVGRSAWSIMDEVGHHYLIDGHVRLIGPVAHFASTRIVLMSKSDSCALMLLLFPGSDLGYPSPVRVCL
jgi:hypothetical protein